MRLGRKRARFVNGVVAVALVSVLGSTSAWAATKTEQAKSRQKQINQQVATLRDQVAEASAEETAILTQLDAIEERKRPLMEAIAVLDADIADVESQLDAAEQELAERQAAVKASEEHLGRVKSQVEALRLRVQRRAVASYVTGSDYAASTALLERRSAKDTAVKKGYEHALDGAEEREMSDLKKLEKKAKELKFVLDAARTVAAQQRDSVVSQRADLQARRDEQEVLRQQVVAEEANTAKVLEAIQERKGEFLSELATLTRESDSITSMLRTSQTGQGTTSVGKGILGNPLPGARMSSPFGPRTHPIFGDVRMHTGQDFSAASGTPILAAGDGVVVSAGVRSGYGNTTIIDHGGSLATLYAHQSRFGVASGDVVKRGQVIGYVGSTGNSTGPHLHFETRVQGTPVSPLNYL